MVAGAACSHATWTPNSSTLTDDMAISFEKASRALPCALLLRSTFCLRLPRSRPRAGGGWAAPLPSGKGLGMGGLVLSQPKQCAGHPAHRIEIPQQVPLTKDGGAVWGSAMGRPGARAASRIQARARAAAARRTHSLA